MGLSKVYSKVFISVLQHWLSSVLPAFCHRLLLSCKNDSLYYRRKIYKGGCKKWRVLGVYNTTMFGRPVCVIRWSEMHVFCLGLFLFYPETWLQAQPIFRPWCICVFSSHRYNLIYLVFKFLPNSFVSIFPTLDIRFTTFILF